MSGVFKAAFIFVAPEAQPSMHSSWVKTKQVEVKTVAAVDYQQACELAESLVGEGIQAIELCAGFGHIGVAEVVKAVDGRVPVGVVRFDKHPCLNFASGDELFLANDR
ncbi:DUF6506 family protein [Vibrio sp. CAU 1672]|uniref:DUF6506 family protein n=1 Tax=Vibrio sp. CAU 1672 TaxID=3032594 RepID=UPI0023DC5AE0|nr:DUF6506 family protein [Vibrio sp. CAU 1672]MDF2156057.1 DUF6506 family protein [Vibrio sp. CAU 1672]